MTAHNVPDRESRNPSPVEPGGLPVETGPVSQPVVGGQGRALVRGALGGVAGAVAFTLFTMIGFAVEGRGAWQPLNLVAHSFWSKAPDDGTFSLPAFLLGLAVVLLAGVLLALPIALLVHNTDPHWAMVMALAVVIPNVVWVIGHGLAWPAVNNHAAVLFFPFWSWMGHMVYGLVLGAVLLATRGHRRSRPSR